MTKLLELIKTHLLKDKKSQKTIDIYLSRLIKLNGDVQPKSIKYLRNVEEVKAYFNTNNYSIVSQKSYLGTINSILKINPTKLNMKAISDYQNFFTQEEILQLNNKDTKTEKQESNWITWDQILEIKNNLKLKARLAFESESPIRSQYNSLLENLLLSFYINIQPRRAKDYSEMKIQQPNQEMNTEYNYLTIDNTFIFNTYKTEKTYGKQIINISANEDLLEDLNLYLAHRINNEDDFLLVKHNGKQFNHINDITRILNKIFGSKISVNMLRNIFITFKYSDTKKQMIDDATNMGHSVITQQSIYNKQ